MRRILAAVAVSAAVSAIFGCGGSDKDGPASMPPVANAGPPVTLTAGQPFTFDGSSSYDYDGSVVAWSWNFADGAVVPEAIVAHTFSSPGIYAVKLTVTDDEEISSTIDKEVTVVAP